MRIYKILTAWIGGAALLMSSAVMAEIYPDKPVKLVVPYAPGGAVDMMARVLAKELQSLTGQAYIVENKGGAGGAIAAMSVVNARPDGYTILIGATGPNVIVPAVHGASAGFDPANDLTAVSLIASTPYVLVTNSTVPVETVADLMEHIKSRPGKMNYGSSGAGGPDHLGGELFKIMMDGDVVHVPYKGSGPALVALMANEVQYVFVSPLPSMPLVESGKLHLLAITSKERSAAMPEVPTVAESLTGFDLTPWYGLFVPGGTSPDIVAMINEQLRSVLARENVQELFRGRGLDPITNTPEEFRIFVDEELAKWNTVVENAGVRVD